MLLLEHEVGRVDGKLVHEKDANESVGFALQVANEIEREVDEVERQRLELSGDGYMGEVADASCDGAEQLLGGFEASSTAALQQRLEHATNVCSSLGRNVVVQIHLQETVEEHEARELAAHVSRGRGIVREKTLGVVVDDRNELSELKLREKIALLLNRMEQSLDDRLAVDSHIVGDGDIVEDRLHQRMETRGYQNNQGQKGG